MGIKKLLNGASLPSLTQAQTADTSMDIGIGQGDFASFVVVLFQQPMPHLLLEPHQARAMAAALSAQADAIDLPN